MLFEPLAAEGPTLANIVSDPFLLLVRNIYTMPFSNSIEFGFLGHPLIISSDNYDISPLPDLTDRIACVKQYTHVDGYIYPPLIQTVTIDPITGETKPKDNTERPAVVFREIASHSIILKNKTPTKIPFFDESIIVHLIAFIYGTRLQISKWKLDGRIPIKPTINIIISDSTRIKFIDHAYLQWKNHTELIQKKIINILYFYARANSIEDEWDSFIHQYMAFDAIFSVFYELHKKEITRKTKNGKEKLIPHGERFDVMLNYYTIPKNEILIQHIYDTRNEVFHEALWTGQMVGFGADSNNYLLPYHLSRLNARLICNLLSYKNDYATSAWWSMGSFMFSSI